ncbi:hypothetical protein F5Y15DRAFT_414867 [Xylariaceae sp. FL0016]|nr:hypothetical protein F5Y15DRAFT_414867 [Xylariaceae sp. FL0016]
MPKIITKLKPEAFWPKSMDKECDKAARILKSFTSLTSSSGSRASPTAGRNIRIPPSALANAKGLAIFTGLRAGMWLSGAGGSGLVVARLPDGSWSPPSGFLVRSVGAGIVGGVDIYDCVCVLNTEEAVAAYAKSRVSLGGEVAVAAGPLGGSLTDGKGDVNPVWSYTKSRGVWGGLTVDGTVIIARPDANAEFYGEAVEVECIFRGEVPGATAENTGGKMKQEKGRLMWPEGARQLTEVLKVVEGKNADAAVMNQVGEEPTPGDLVLQPEGQKSA